MKKNQYLPKKVLSCLSLVMINVIAVDSIRTLPMAASYGFGLISLYLIGAVGFFIPTALMTAELATTWPEKGGIYSWAKIAFGEKWGFCVVYLQWIYNIIWYPTILTLIASTVAYLYDPTLIQNATFITTMVLATFWGCTFLNIFGMRFSSFVSTIGSICGTMGPMLLIMILAIFWLKQGNQPEIDISYQSAIPKFSSLAEIVFFTQIIYSLLGIEMSSVHALEVKNPKRDYPLALLISTGIILISLILASLAIAIVIPEKSLDNLTGIIQSFQLFSKSFDLQWMDKFIACAIFIGGIASVATWIIGPTKGLFAAASDGLLPKKLAYFNTRNVPTNILILQGIICTLLTLTYLFLPSVEASYFVLSQMTASLAMLMYIILFACVIRLRYSHPQVVRPFKIPYKNVGAWLVCGLGIITCTCVILIGFIPPTGKINIDGAISYPLIISLGMLITLMPVAFIHSKRKKSIKGL